MNNAWGITKTFFGLTGGRGGVPEDLPIDHNTTIPGGYSAYYVDVVHSPAMVRLRLTNNLIGFGSFGVSSPKGDSKWLPYATIARNALLSLADTGDGQGAVRNRPPDIADTSFPMPRRRDSIRREPSRRKARIGGREPTKRTSASTSTNFYKRIQVNVPPSENAASVVRIWPTSRSTATNARELGGRDGWRGRSKAATIIR
ncbi:MAG TPA: hypothetical protein VNZ26_27255 [Vicinamibacterales bacterium]|nr:hypothetical protein [Vicinamibacterales bacterium]